MSLVYQHSSISELDADSNAASMILVVDVKALILTSKTSRVALGSIEKSLTASLKWLYSRTL